MEENIPVQGKDVMLFVDNKAIAYATSCSVSKTASTSEAASKDDGMWENSIVTKLGWEMKVDAFVGKTRDSYKELNAAWKARKQVKVVYGKPANASDNGLPEGGWTAPTADYEEGMAYVTSLERNDPNGENSTFSATLKGVGELKDVTV